MLPFLCIYGENTNKKPSNRQTIFEQENVVIEWASDIFDWTSPRLLYIYIYTAYTQRTQHV